MIFMEVIILNSSEKLKIIRRELDLKQGDFAERISTTQGHISDIENGRKMLSDRTIKLICLEFGINEEWLRNGKGEMFAKITQEDEYFKAATQILKNGDDLIMSMIVEYWKLDESSKETFRKYIRSVAGSIKKEQD